MLLKYWMRIQERLYKIALKYSVVEEMVEAKLIHLDGKTLTIPDEVTIEQPANAGALVILPRNCVIR